MIDEGESITLCEPLMVAEDSPHYRELVELAHDLGAKSAGLSASLPVAMQDSLADAMRAMNCYYSNLIEGHDTHPISAERAMQGDLSADPKERNLQLEAKAHIKVQKWIDEGGLKSHPTAPESILEIQSKFCADLPPAFLISRNQKTGEEREVVPGVFRDHHVQVGQHVAISPGAVPRFMQHLHKRYDTAGKLAAILNAAYAHHRIAWVHPFGDLNGRVVRMVSHAMLLDSTASNGLWSVSRGLARQRGDYRRFLQAADEPRRGDRDGRGNLSEAQLAGFARFFLAACIDQVEFMGGLMEPEKLRQRVMRWTRREMEDRRLPKKSDIVMRLALASGEVERAEVAAVLGMSDRAARKITKQLVDAGVLKSKSSRAPLRLNFPARLAQDWMPGLFPVA